MSDTLILTWLDTDAADMTPGEFEKAMVDYLVEEAQVNDVFNGSDEEVTRLALGVAKFAWEKLRGEDEDGSGG